MKNLYKAVLLFALVAVMVGGIMKGAGKMKDIEIDPGKIIHTGNSNQLYPSIASSEATVHFWFDTDGVVNLKVYDLQGKVVDGVEGTIRKSRTIETTIDVTGLQNGTYLARLIHENGTSLTSKFVVAH